MFNIDYIHSEQFVGSIRQSTGQNTLTFLTGVNGTGKSRLLAGLVNFYCKRSRNEKSDRKEFYALSGGKTPSRVVTQTFSPFSKFPSPNIRGRENATTSISDLVADRTRDVDFYVPIGFHRRTRTPSTGAGRRVIEDALLALSNDHAAKAPPLASALRHVGLRPSLSIRYIASIPATEMFSPDLSEIGLRNLITARVKDAVDGPFSLGTDSVLRRQAEISGFERLVNDVVAALRRVRGQVQELMVDRRALLYALDFEHIDENEMDLLRALLLLRRAGLLRVREISFDPPARQVGSESLMHDVDELSSGQLQLISTVFSLATTVCDNSLVLIDEPELSLHPKWQVDWVRLVEGAFSQYSGCHIIVATHSPLLASSAHESGHEIISLDQRKSSASSSNEGSLGLSDHVSVEEMLLKGFSTPTPYSQYLSNFLMEAIGSVTATRAKKRALIVELDKIALIYSGEPESKSLIEDAKRLLNG